MNKSGHVEWKKMWIIQDEVKHLISSNIFIENRDEKINMVWWMFESKGGVSTFTIDSRIIPTKTSQKFYLQSHA